MRQPNELARLFSGSGATYTYHPFCRAFSAIALLYPYLGLADSAQAKIFQRFAPLCCEPSPSFVLTRLAICHLLSVILPMSATGNDQQAFQEAIRRFDEANGADPNTFIIDGKPVPYELFYAQRLTEWVERLSPRASPALRLAARCQHICRWMIPRNSYPMTRAGYLKWRTDLKQFHAKKSGEIMADSGCSEALVARVQQLNLKKNLGQDEELQVLEDALCLVTLQYQLTDLVRKTEPEKMLSILQKTWKKMSAQARGEALRLPYPEDQKSLLSRALSAAES
jgi:hypothetical protein